MTEIAIEEGAKLVLKTLAPIAGYLALIAVGFAAAETWEHTKHPTVFSWSPFGRSLSTKLHDEIASEPAKIQVALRQGMDVQSKADKPYFDAWALRLAQDEKQIDQLRNAAAEAVHQQDRFTTTQADAAFRLGQASCGASHAQAVTPASGPGPGGVRQSASPDFADLFEPGAFTAPGQASLPAGGDGAGR